MGIRQIGMSPTGTIADPTVKSIVQFPLLVEVGLLVDEEFTGLLMIASYLDSLVCIRAIMQMEVL